MGAEVSWAEIPQRIIARYVENFEFLMSQVLELFKDKDDASIDEPGVDEKGFNKLLILLTKPGKIFAV